MSPNTLIVGNKISPQIKSSFKKGVYFFLIIKGLTENHSELDEKKDYAWLLYLAWLLCFDISRETLREKVLLFIQLISNAIQFSCKPSLYIIVC